MSPFLSQSAKSRQGTNNFNLLRLILASLVIVSHSPELIDGNRSHEVLTLVFHTLSFGEVAVDGFFLISGYLITQSFVQSPNGLAFLVKRIARIVPAYMVCFWLCVLLIAPNFGARDNVFSLASIRDTLIESLNLLPPYVEGAFQGVHFAQLNGAMWTIHFEFMCYLLTLALGMTGIFVSRYKILIPIAALCFLIANIFLNVGADHVHLTTTGGIESVCRFIGVFAAGSSAFLFRSHLRFTNLAASLALSAMILCLSNPYLAELGFTLFGGYLVFWLALHLRPIRGTGLLTTTDISYGLYLYGWPLQCALLTFYPPISAAVLCLATLVGASAFGFASWMLVEKPAQKWIKQRFSAVSPAPIAIKVPG